jgi:hypothetical protein
MVLSVSTRHRLADVWMLASELTSKRRLLLYAYGKLFDGFFCNLTCSMLEKVSYGRMSNELLASEIFW